jgi:2-methylisocitrate lyase-like PEP mutase family enzyme
MAAHNPLAAKLAATAGFDAIWGNGLELSASYAVPDANILSVDTHLELMRPIGEAQDAPVIANTTPATAMRSTSPIWCRATRPPASLRLSSRTRRSQRTAACDPAGGRYWCRSRSSKARSRPPGFPATRWWWHGPRQLIAGLGQDWALRRGISYAEAGADAVLIRSREKTPAEILEFCHAWPGPVPLVLVPTAYPQLSFAEIAALRKVGLIICANHAIRAAVAAMRATFARILTEGGIAGVEGSIASVAEIFDLQGDGRMRELERRFLR